MPSTIATRFTFLRPFAFGCALAILGGCASDPTVAAPPPCSGECRTHDDGYQWAQSGTLSDPKQCDNGHYTAAFVLGCKDAVNDFSQMRPASTGL